MPSVLASDRAHIPVLRARAWLLEMERCVRSCDYAGARELFTPEALAFGTRANVARGIDAIDREQWRWTWPRIRDFSFQLEELHCTSGEEAITVAVGWHSLGVNDDGSSFQRPGRATVVLVEREDRLVAIHSHFSLESGRDPMSTVASEAGLDRPSRGGEWRGSLLRPALPPGPYLVVGAGRAGHAAATALSRLAGSAQVTVWDSEVTLATAATRRELRRIGITVELGGPAAKLPEKLGCVVKSPGVPPAAPVLAAASARSLPVLDELELGWRLLGRPVIGITGTNGKGTVGALVTAALRADGSSAVHTGNWEIGRPLSALTPVRHGGWVVCEVSSYQLESAPGFLPEVAVLTNFSSDHMDRHRTMHAYGRAKRRMFGSHGRPPWRSVIGIDEPFGSRLAADCEALGSTVIRVGSGPAADYRARAGPWSVDAGRRGDRNAGRRRPALFPVAGTAQRSQPGGRSGGRGRPRRGSRSGAGCVRGLPRRARSL